MEEEERETTTFDELCPDLINAVLRRAPLLSRTRLKPVSKSWCHQITTLRRLAPPTTPSGIITFCRQVHGDPNLHQSHLLRIKNSNALSLSYPWLLDSCNGLVLYAKKNETHNWVYCVSSPVLNQYSYLDIYNICVPDIGVCLICSFSSWSMLYRYLIGKEQQSSNGNSASL